jgi:hypothetical protein
MATARTDDIHAATPITTKSARMALVGRLTAENVLQLQRLAGNAAARALIEATTRSGRSALQRMATTTTDNLRNAAPAYLQELASIHHPGLWDHTNNGGFAVSHKGRKYALGVDDANYSAGILTTTDRTKLFGSYHFSKEIDVIRASMKTALHGKDCAAAADYLLHKQRGLDPADRYGKYSQFEKSTGISSAYDPTTQRPNVLPNQVPAGVKDANARAEIGEAYCIVSEPNSGKYNFHYGFVAAKRNDETLTVEGFATGNNMTTPDWSFNAYDSVSTFHSVWQPNMTKVAPPLAPGYPFTFVTTLNL